MFQRFVNLLQRLWARLSWTGGVHYLNGGPGLPPPLTPEEEKALLARMADGDPAARDELITHNLLWCLVRWAYGFRRHADSEPYTCGRREQPFRAYGYKDHYEWD